MVTMGGELRCIGPYLINTVFSHCGRNHQAADECGGGQDFQRAYGLLVD